jgi:hypothetical protein
VLVNRGDGTFQAHVDYDTDLGPDWVAVGDLNGDGHADVVTANGGTDETVSETASVLLNKGDGTFSSGVDYATGSAPVEVRIGDLNGDNHADLVSANFFSDSVSVLLGRGDGSFGGDLEYPAGRWPLSVAIGELNRDGQRDLATANWGSRSVSVLFNASGLCAVPQLRGKTLTAARRELVFTGCSRGKVGRAYSKKVKKGRVLTQKPAYGAVLPNGGPVDLVLSKGARR